MVGTICLAGRETRTCQQRLVDCVAFGVAATVGGACLGLLVTVGGIGLGRLPAGHVATAGAAGVLASLLLLESIDVQVGRPPGPRRQVPLATMIRRGPRQAAAIWGAQLGFGVATRVTTWGFWAWLAALASLGEPSVGVASGAVYGVVRGLQPFATVVLSGDNVKALTERAWGLDRRLRTGAVASAIALVWLLSWQFGLWERG